jgi:tRNA U55 pseudouridine synthase TruB
MTTMSTALVPLSKDAVSVVTVLENAKAWLSTAVDMTGPEEIAAAKAHIRTAETYARELNLSKDIQLEAQEMVRRAEYALGKAIRKGQERGEITNLSTAALQRERAKSTESLEDSVLSRPTDFATHAELFGNSAGIYDVADDVTAEDFETAIDAAKGEGNLSRANVVRKVKAKTRSRDDRADLIEELAAKGYTSRQMPAKVGVSEETVRQIARDFGIEIPADKTMGKTRRHDSNRIARETVAALEGLAMAADLINYDDIAEEEAAHWAISLDESLKVLNRFRKQIKEMAQ